MSTTKRGGLFNFLRACIKLTISRRRAFVLVGTFLMLLIFFKWRPVIKLFLSKPEKKMGEADHANHFSEDGKALVAVVRGDNVDAMVREAVALIGGLETIGIKGKSVLVKPNVVSEAPHPITTNPEVVRAVVRLLYKEGARKVYVGDMSAMLALPTGKNMERNGIKRAAEEAGAEVVCFEDHGWVKVELPQARFIKKVNVTEWLYKVDRIVNVPVIKTHRSASYSICLKNFIGATHIKQRPYLIDPAHWEELIAEMNLAWHPHLNIIDGTKTLIEYGPWEGPAADTGLIIATGDRVAGDITGLEIIKRFGRWAMVTEKDVWEQKQIRRAVELGLGVGKGGIKVVEKKL